MSVILYGASLTYKSSIIRAMQCDAHKVFSISNSILIDHAQRLSKDPAEISKYVLFGRIAALEARWSYECPEAWFDRGLLDQYTWCTIYGATGLPSPREIYDLETQLVYDKEPVNRRFIINRDFNHIKEVIDTSLRKTYLNVPSTDDFINKINMYNNKFRELFDVPTVVINNFKEELCGGTNVIQPNLVKEVLHI